MENYYIVEEERKILDEIKSTKAKCIGLVFRRNYVLRGVIEGKIVKRYKGRKYEEEDVRSYWKALRKRDDTVI